MIDWTNIKKIDAHIHLMPSDVIEANKEFASITSDGIKCICASIFFIFVQSIILFLLKIS